MNIVSNCPLCEEHGLHVMGDENDKLLQCLSCGYVSANKYIITDGWENNEAYKELPEDMKKWSKTSENRVWIPAMITLPNGVLYPFDDHKDIMRWELAQMVDIPEEDQKNYPDGNGGFYTRRYDTSTSIVFATFLEGMAEISQNAINEGTATEDSEVKLEVDKSQNAKKN